MLENFLTKQDTKLIKTAYISLNIAFAFSFISFLIYSIFNLAVVWDMSKQFDMNLFITILYTVTFCLLLISCFTIIRAIIRACENIAKIKFISVAQLNQKEE